MPKPTVADIMDFAKNSRPARGRVCWVCLQPNVSDLNEAYRKGVQVSTLQRYMVEKLGADPREATKHRLGYHFGAQKHHL